MQKWINVILDTKAQQFSISHLDQLKANGHPTSATHLARQFNVTPHAARQWLTAFSKNRTCKPSGSRLTHVGFGMVLEDSFVADYMSLCEVDRVAVRAVVGGFFKVTTPRLEP